EDKGIRVGVLSSDEAFDACTFQADVDGGVPVIVTNESTPGDRQRFNLSHELGHIMLDLVEDQAEGFTAARACHRVEGALRATRLSRIAALGAPRRRLRPHEL